MESNYEVIRRRWGIHARRVASSAGELTEIRPGLLVREKMDVVLESEKRFQPGFLLFGARALQSEAVLRGVEGKHDASFGIMFLVYVEATPNVD